MINFLNYKYEYVDQFKGDGLVHHNIRCCDEDIDFAVKCDRTTILNNCLDGMFGCCSWTDNQCECATWLEKVRTLDDDIAALRYGVKYIIGYWSDSATSDIIENVVKRIELDPIGYGRSNFPVINEYISRLV